MRKASRWAWNHWPAWRWQRGQASAAAKVVAGIIAVAPDGDCREQDIRQLRDCGVVCHDGGCALPFGRSRRGASAKTGRGHGVLLDSNQTMKVAQRRTAGLEPLAQVFLITAAALRDWWTKSAEAAAGGRQQTEPPDSMRHTGASRDLCFRWRGLEVVVRRGRWQALASVRRYGSIHGWLAACARQPEDVLRKC